MGALGRLEEHYYFSALAYCLHPQRGDRDQLPGSSGVVDCDCGDPEGDPAQQHGFLPAPDCLSRRLWRDVRGRRRAHRSLGHTPRLSRHHDRVVAGVRRATVWRPDCGSLALSRFLLGAGEGGGFPAATKAVAEWFPARERSTAMGIINAGTAVGAVVAPPLIAAIVLYADWRWVFITCGAAGLLWTAWWWASYQVPGDHRRLSAAERAVIGDVVADTGAGRTAADTVAQPLAFREVWGLVLAKFLTDGAWYFYLFWLPKYSYDARGFDVKQVGYYAWIPYAAAGIGSLIGGWFSSRLVTSGRSIDAARKIALGASAAVMPVIIFVTHVPVELAIVLFSVAFFGQQSWSTLVMIVPTDLFPRRSVGSVAGLVGFGGAMGGIVFNLVAGRMLDLGMGYGTVFSIMGMCHVTAFVVILLSIRKIQPLGHAEK